jgi:predicted enzyme related to lactoylglutathione lyase
MPGQKVHVEIPAGDTAKACEFWGSLFGWQWQTFEGPTEYHMTRFSETTGGAIYAPDPPDKRGARVYFDVDDITAGSARVNELGGEAGEPMPRHGLVRHLHGHGGQRVRPLAERSGSAGTEPVSKALPG